ncbi:hypothetical protein [Oceanibaculum nanhaiense]|uniref:hypothetical protein n=1 Tax=Oceanibaculum nanhaiense TaxID=1909734 RepID=UPI003F70F4DE
MNDSTELSIEKFKNGKWSSVTREDWENLAIETQHRIATRPLPHISLKVRSNLLAFRDAYRAALHSDGDIYYVRNLPRPAISEAHLSLSEQVENGVERALEAIDRAYQDKSNTPIEFQGDSSHFYTRNLVVLLKSDVFPDPWRLHMSLWPYLKEMLELFDESEWRDETDGGPREEPTVRIWERNYRS